MKKVKVLNYSVRQLRLNKIDKLFYNTEGVMYADAGKFKEAAACFTKAIELAPNLGARSDFALSESFQLSKSHLIKFGMN